VPALSEYAGIRLNTLVSGDDVLVWMDAHLHPFAGKIRCIAADRRKERARHRRRNDMARDKKLTAFMASGAAQ